MEKGGRWKIEMHFVNERAEKRMGDERYKKKKGKRPGKSEMGRKEKIKD